MTTTALEENSSNEIGHKQQQSLEHVGRREESTEQSQNVPLAKELGLRSKSSPSFQIFPRKSILKQSRSSVRSCLRQTSSDNELDNSKVDNDTSFQSSHMRQSSTSNVLIVSERSRSDHKPMEKKARWAMGARRCFASLKGWCLSFRTSGSSQAKRRSSSVNSFFPGTKDFATQYTLRAMHGPKQKCFESEDCSDCCFVCCNLGVSANLFRVVFQSSISVTLLFIFATFAIWTIFFACLLFFAGKNTPGCFGTGYNQPDVTTGQNELRELKFSAAYSLSWATFSTVGYGHLYPWHGSPDLSCDFLEGICVMESFVGLIYVSFCGAIFFARVLRAQTQAEVRFSDAICIRYGTGVAGSGALNDLGSDLMLRSENGFDEEKQDTFDATPCPVLEFRIVNELANTHKGGELINAEIKCVIGRLESPDDVIEPTLQSQRNVSRQRFSQAGLSALKRKMSPVIVTHNGNQASGGKDQLGRHTGNFSRNINPDELTVTQPIFPYFRQIWWVRHVLNEHSNLLVPNARNRIAHNNGLWPTEWSSHAGIRNCLIDFDQIIVTLTATSASSASTVYSQKAYSYADVVIGYKFADMIIDGRQKLDFRYIDDVKEQAPGDGEPLISLDSVLDFMTSTE